ncbi:MAG: hypothetical protein JWO46_1672 [Nocardioidaceae bacterium]|nr:hypothetical protein [Nocardioidaceae bacterium]
MFDHVTPTHAEVAARLPGDDLVPADVVMDRGFTLDAPPATVWPWLVQVGKGRAGWYFPRAIERVIPVGRRGAWRLLPAFQQHAVGDTIADWGGADATLTLAAAEEPSYLSYRSQRGRASFTWTLQLTPLGGGRTRVHSRVRMGPVRRPWLAERVGGLFDEATIAGLAAGLRERLAA